MKIKLATIFWAITTLCLALGWFWERQYHKKQLESRIETQVSVECSLTAALYKNLIWERLREKELAERSEVDFADFRQSSLVENIIYLFLNERSATNKKTILANGWTENTDQKGRTLRFAGHSMDLLQLDSSEQLVPLLKKDDRYFDWHGDELFDQNREVKTEFREFADRSIQAFHYTTGPPR